jgi:hypothetical protein
MALLCALESWHGSYLSYALTSRMPLVGRLNPNYLSGISTCRELCDGVAVTVRRHVCKIGEKFLSILASEVYGPTK